MRAGFEWAERRMAGMWLSHFVSDFRAKEMIVIVLELKDKILSSSGLVVCAMCDPAISISSQSLVRSDLLPTFGDGGDSI